MNFDPIIPPVESSTLAPESLQWASDLAERISLTLRSLAVGRLSGSVTLDDAVPETTRIWDEVEDLRRLVIGMGRDGGQQLATERAVVAHALGLGGA